MTPQIAQAALEFLSRVDLRGNEAEAMVLVKQAIRLFLDQAEQTPENDLANDGSGET